MARRRSATQVQEGQRASQAERSKSRKSASDVRPRWQAHRDRPWWYYFIIFFSQFLVARTRESIAQGSFAHSDCRCQEPGEHPSWRQGAYYGGSAGGPSNETARTQQGEEGAYEGGKDPLRHREERIQLLEVEARDPIGTGEAEKRHMSVLQQLQTDLKMIEATGEDKMDGESEEEETEGSKALAKEVDEMKQHMGQMATYVQKMEQRNCELAQQMQFLISAVKDSRPFEPLTKDSPQIVRTPPGRALLAGGRKDDSKERSRSPMKRPAPDLVEQIEGLGEVPVVMAELLEQLPSEQRSQILAMVRAEPQRYNSPQAVMDLAASIQTQIAASIQVKGTFEAGNKSCASSAALQPFRRESKARLAKCQKGTESPVSPLDAMTG